MALTRRSFLRNLGVLAGALGIGLTVSKPQQRTVETFTTKPKPDYILGYKGHQFIEAGIIYAPYIPLYTTDNTVGPIPTRFAERYSSVGLTSGKNLLQLD